jgi:hypothetical protein
LRLTTIVELRQRRMHVAELPIVPGQLRGVEDDRRNAARIADAQGTLARRFGCNSKHAAPIRLAADGHGVRHSKRRAQSIRRHGAAKFKLRTRDWLVARRACLHLESAAQQLSMNIRPGDLAAVDIELPYDIGGRRRRA